MWYIYLLYSKSKNKRYVGSTNDLDRRLVEHLRGKTTYTRGIKDWEIVFYREVGDEQQARLQEKQIKKNKKHRLLFYKEAEQSGRSLVG